MPVSPSPSVFNSPDNHSFQLSHHHPSAFSQQSFTPQLSFRLQSNPLTVHHASQSPTRDSSHPTASYFTPYSSQPVNSNMRAHHPSQHDLSIPRSSSRHNHNDHQMHQHQQRQQPQQQQQSQQEQPHHQHLHQHHHHHHHHHHDPQHTHIQSQSHLQLQHDPFSDSLLMSDSYSQFSSQLPQQTLAPGNSLRQEHDSYYDPSSLSTFSNNGHQIQAHAQELVSSRYPLERSQSVVESSAVPDQSPLTRQLPSSSIPNIKSRKSALPVQMSFPEVALNPLDETPLSPNTYLASTVYPADIHSLPSNPQQHTIIPQLAQTIPSIRSLSESTHHHALLQHNAPFVSVQSTDQNFTNVTNTVPAQLPQPIYPPHAAVVLTPQESQYSIQAVLPGIPPVQTHHNVIANAVAAPSVYPSSAQPKSEVLFMNAFQQSLDSVLPPSGPSASAMTLHSVLPQHQVSALPGLTLTDMISAPQVSVPIEMLDSFLAIGRACRSIGRYDLASDAFRACMAICPESPEAVMSYQSSCRWNGIDTSRPDFARTLDLSHIFPEDVFNDIGNALRSLGRTNEAEMAYRAALNIAPRHAHAWNNLGNAMRARGAVMDAMSCYSASLTYQPGFPAAHCNLAGLMRDQGKPQEAETQYRAALLSDPNLAEAAAGLGTALRDMGRTDEAVTFYLRSVTLQPDAADHHANLANTYKDLNRIEESIGSYEAALAIQPDMPDAFCNMVHSLSVICDWRNRSQNFVTLLNIIDKQLDTLMRHPGTTSRLYSTLVGALSNSTPQLVDVCGGSRSDRDSVSVSASNGKEENSSDVIRRRKFVHHPSSPTVVKKAKNKTKFSKFMTNTSSVVAPVLASGLPSVQPFHALIYPMSPEKFRALSAAYASRAESMVAGIPPVNQSWTVPRGSRARLKVGYVSSDYNNHPYSHLTQSIYGLHGTGSSVECYCYALTPSDQSAWRLRIERESEHFRDISGLTAKQSAEAIANDGIHVLVNCNGYTKGARTELFALRPAPVQVSFMGFPGTLGAPYIEYFITDVVTSPPELSSRMHSEALLYHPHSYFVNDHRQTSFPGPKAYPSGQLTRAHYNLPEDCFLFIMHNQLYKLSPDTFDVWARILKRVPNSKIWLLRFPPSGEQRIRQEAAARGLAPDRLVFTDVAGKEEHVARAGLGDLFLDTPTCNAHTTGTDVLWSGCPMITCPGSLFASRVAASLLMAAGLPELIAQDMNEYEDLAVELATNRPKLAQIRAKIESSRYTNALFDTERWVRNVEALYWRAWKNFDDHNEPRHIYGQDVYDGSTMVSQAIPTSNGTVSNVDSFYPGADSWHSESPFSGRVFNSTVMT